MPLKKNHSNYWTRSGWVTVPFGPYEDVESLTLSPIVRESVMALGMAFSAGKELSEGLAAVWRYGLLLVGPAGMGKRSATKALCLLTDLPHVVITEREVLDHHSLTVALTEVIKRGPAVVLIEDLDRIFGRISERDFFSVFDAVNMVADGYLWCATTTVPEDVPKQLLLRPGRFDELLRLVPPQAKVREEFFKKHVLPSMASPGEGPQALSDEFLRYLVQESDGFSFAQMVELRARAAALKLRGRTSELTDELKAYCRDQRIAGDRYGRYSREDEQLKDRVRHTDPRALAAALHVTDAFKKVIDAALTAQTEEKNYEITQ
jgi:SpoVK/Ycf46/Vps4 family AAA+-type ATPase